MPNCDPRLSVEDALELLASSRRRRLLRYLLEEDDLVAERDEIAAAIAREDSLDAATLETALAHIHLPKCADVGVIEYDHRSGTARLTPAAEQLAPLLEAVWEQWEEPGD